MNYKKIETDHYNIHLIKTERFKTITITTTFMNKIKKDEITKRNLLVDMLVYSCKKYPSRRDMVIKLQDLYAAQISSSRERICNYNSIKINKTTLNNKYTNKRNLKEAFKFLKEIILNHHIDNGQFKEESFKINYNKIESQIQTIKENPQKYCLIRMVESMDKKKAYSYHGFGNLKDLLQITRHNLYNFYKKFIRTSIVDIYIIGNIDFDESEQLIKNTFKNKFNKSQIEDLTIENEQPKKIKVIKEKEKGLNQSKLSMGLKTIGLNEFEKKYVVTLYNTILGGSIDSKFFLNIREKNSLAYYINSRVDKYDNLITIVSGISADNFTKIVELIKKEINNMIDGNITDEEITIAKNFYITLLQELYDSPIALIDSYFSMHILGTDDINTRMKKIQEVSKDDIVNLSKKIYLDTVFLLEGDQNEEN